MRGIDFAEHSVPSNWGRWGATDERGTLNLITPAEALVAAALIKDGVVVGCSRPLDHRTDNARVGVDEFRLEIAPAPPNAASAGGEVRVDRIIVGAHGAAFTHLDAPVHVALDGWSYNARDVQHGLGAGVSASAPGVVGRGVLIDVPRWRGTEWIRPGTAIGPADIDGCFEAAGLHPRPGDVVFVRTGRDAWEAAGQKVARHTTGVPGLAPECVTWLHEHDVGVLVSDVGQGAGGPADDELEAIHFGGLTGLGLWLVDNAELGALAQACAVRSRWEFCTILAPLPIFGATGCPIAPVTIF